ncbi:MAG: hypothetical protein JSS87_06935 [Acidobacteria bacterium]|nr:hypothetical protein [Acidobacteriota bacterium]
MSAEFVTGLENEIAARSKAAAEYFARVHDRVKTLTDDLCHDSKKSNTFGREFLMITLTEKKVDTGIAFRRLDIKSQYVSAYISANTGEPGEFKACIGYDASTRKPKHCTIYFPTEGAESPEALADNLVRSIVLPNDEPL